MCITVHNEVSWLCPLPEQELAQLLEAMLSFYTTTEAMDVVLHVVRDARIWSLNAKHMSCAGPTNILSFPAMEGRALGQRAVIRVQEDVSTAIPPKQPAILVLSVDTLQRECMLYGQELQEHLVRLLAHGLGHVLGYDHGEEMFALCDAMEDVGMSFIQRKI